MHKHGDGDDNDYDSNDHADEEDGYNEKAYSDDTTTTTCPLYTSDAAAEEVSVDLGGRRIFNNNDTNN